MQVVAVTPKVVPFPIGRNIPREISDKVSELAIAQGLESHVFLTKEQLSEVILVALGTYREVTGR